MTSHHRSRPGLALATASAGRRGPREIDHAAVQRAARELLLALGADVEGRALQETPRRMADAYAELLTPQPFRRPRSRTTTATTS